MVSRCEDPKVTAYKYYGARGISVCERWHSVKIFFEDMGERPVGTSLDRIDNTKGYYKENCRWATRYIQSRNTSRTKTITWNGETKTVTDWGRQFNIPHTSLLSGLRCGKSLEEIISRHMADATKGTLAGLVNSTLTTNS
jgi:hypothetical protein